MTTLPPLDIEDLRSLINKGIYADDRQTPRELDESLAALKALVDHAQMLEAWIKTGELRGLLYTARTALHKATPNVSPEGAPVSDGWRVIWLCQHAEAMELEITKLKDSGYRDTEDDG